jgi:hypothetical protein
MYATHRDHAGHALNRQ